MTTLAPTGVARAARRWANDTQPQAHIQVDLLVYVDDSGLEIYAVPRRALAFSGLTRSKR